MKITDLRTERVVVPFDEPLRTSIHRIDSVGCVLVTLESDEGLVGESNLPIPDRPGLGFSFDRAAVARHRVPS